MFHTTCDCQNKETSYQIESIQSSPSLEVEVRTWDKKMNQPIANDSLSDTLWTMLFDRTGLPILENIGGVGDVCETSCYGDSRRGWHHRSGSFNGLYCRGIGWHLQLIIQGALLWNLWQRPTPISPGKVVEVRGYLQTIDTDLRPI